MALAYVNEIYTWFPNNLRSVDISHLEGESITVLRNSLIYLTKEGCFKMNPTGNVTKLNIDADEIIALRGEDFVYIKDNYLFHYGVKICKLQNFKHLVWFKDGTIIYQSGNKLCVDGKIIDGLVGDYFWTTDNDMSWGAVNFILGDKIYSFDLSITVSETLATTTKLDDHIMVKTMSNSLTIVCPYGILSILNNFIDLDKVTKIESNEKTILIHFIRITLACNRTSLGCRSFIVLEDIDVQLEIIKTRIKSARAI